MSAKPSKASVLGRPNSLSLGQRELLEIFSEFDDADGHAGHEQRDDVRWPYLQRTVEVSVQNDGYESELNVACRNLSRTGVSILHSSYMHPGTRCTVFLPLSDREATPVKGKVARCAHRRDMIHEVGIAFAEPIEVSTFVRDVLPSNTPGDDSSTLGPDDPAAALVGGYVEDLKRAADMLDAAVKGADVDEARKLCLTLKGNAPTFGFEAIGRTAGEIVDELDGEALEAHEAALHALSARCRGAKAA